MAGLLLLNQLQRVMSPYSEIHSQTDSLLCIQNTRNISQNTYIYIIRQDKIQIRIILGISV